jgi:hypothetical protein
MVRYYTSDELERAQMGHHIAAEQKKWEREHSHDYQRLVCVQRVQDLAAKVIALVEQGVCDKSAAGISAMEEAAKEAWGLS